MKKIFLLLTLACGFIAAQAQIVIPRQEVAYNVKYHWGIIDLMIARGVVSYESDGTRFNGTLDGTSIPWEGKIICVSDTLCADMNYADGAIQENVVYQNGWYRHPGVSQFRSQNYNPDDPATFKNIAGQGDYNASNDSMEAITVTSDMLGMYYYAKAIDFSALKPGDQIIMPINGPYSKQVVITYQGEGVYNNNGNTYPTYNCVFEYDYGGKMSGYEVECKIGASDRVPLYFSADLPVGKVEMLGER